MILNWIKSNIKVLVIGGVLILLVTVFFNWNSAHNKGNELQNVLSAQYKTNQNVLSICDVKIDETANVTKAQAETFKEVMVETVKGRYETGSSAVPDQKSWFSAIIEQYPNMEGLNQSFADVRTVINGCRDDYKGVQSKLLDELRAFDDWKNSTNQGRYFGWGFPSGNLVARIDATHRYTGKEAYERMYDVVLTSNARDAYKTGTLKAKNPLGPTQ